MKLKDIFKKSKKNKQEIKAQRLEKEIKKQQEIIKRFEDRDSCL